VLEANITLVAAVRIFDEVDAPVDVRPVEDGDLEALGRLYFESYPTGVAGNDAVEATRDIAACFAGEYGVLDRDASLLATEDGRIVGVVLVVHDAPWDDTPTGPFIIELMAHPSVRRRGVARCLVTTSMSMLAAGGHQHVALRVDETNTAARTLYDALGFNPWRPR